MESLKRFNAALDRALSKSVFDHVRNYMMCSLLLAIGVRGFNQDADLVFDLVPNTFSGISLVGLSCILFCLNLYDGIREISKSRYHSLFCGIGHDLRRDVCCCDRTGVEFSSVFINQGLHVDNLKQ